MSALSSGVYSLLIGSEEVVINSSARSGNCDKAFFKEVSSHLLRESFN